MEKLTQNYFVSGNVLYASELNQLISKINELIDGNSSYDDTEIQRQLTLLNNTINAEKTRLDGVINDIDGTIQSRVDSMMLDAAFLDELKEGIQSASNFGQQDVDSYLQQIGIITRDGNQLSYGWSTIEQTVNSLSGSVNNLITNGIDQTAVQAAVTASVNDAVANLDLSTMYAKKQAEQVIEWMYSALKQSTGADKTFNEITSAGKNELLSAISDIRTYVGKLENGDYVSTASLSSAVNTAVSSSVSGLATENYVDSATASVYSQVSNDIGTATAGLATTSYVDSEVSSATAGLMAENDFTSAAVIAKVNEYGGSVKISADKIDLDGYVKASDIDATNITAKALLAKENSDYPVVKINSTDGIKLQTTAGGTCAIDVKPNGSGSLANGNLSWDTSGNLTIQSEVGSGVGINVNAINLTDANSTDTGLYLVDQHNNHHAVGIDSNGFLVVRDYASAVWN